MPLPSNGAETIMLKACTTLLCLALVVCIAIGALIVELV